MPLNDCSTSRTTRRQVGYKFSSCAECARLEVINLLDLEMHFHILCKPSLLLCYGSWFPTQSRLIQVNQVMSVQLVCHFFLLSVGGMLSRILISNNKYTGMPKTASARWHTH